MMDCGGAASACCTPPLFAITLVDIRNDLLQVLARQDTLTPADFEHVEMDPALEGQRDPLIRTVIADLVQAGILRQIPAGGSTPEAGKDSWILTQPLGFAGQEIGVTLSTATAMAAEINAFIDGFEKDWPRCDALNLGEHNVLMLLAMVGELRSMDDADGEDWRDGGSGDN